MLQSRLATAWADRPTPTGPCEISPLLDPKVQGLLPGSWGKPCADTFLFSRLVMSDSATPWTAARQASLSFPVSQSLPTFMSTESVMPSSDLIGACETQVHRGWRDQSRGCVGAISLNGQPGAWPLTQAEKAELIPGWAVGPRPGLLPGPLAGAWA